MPEHTVVEKMLVQRLMTCPVCYIFESSLLMLMLIFIFPEGVGACVDVQWFGVWPLVLYQ